MAKKNTAPTMKDVAREANVALGTVSKVINGIPVGEEYRLRTEEAIKKLGYRVNYYAKGLKSNKTYTVALIVPNLINPYFCKIASCINKSLSLKGYQMLVCCSDFDNVQEQNLVTMAEQKKVDGIICLSYNPDLELREGIRFVSIDRYFGGNIPCVAGDNFGGGRMAAEKLIECGCKNLAMFWVGSRLTNEPSKRRDGFVAGCQAAHVPYTVQNVSDGMPFSLFEDFLQEHMQEGRLTIDGIFCVTDWLATRIIDVLRAMGQRVPDDVQVIGFDGVRQFGDQKLYCSTIVQPVDKIADACVDFILSEEESSPTLICLPVQYEFGGTTKL